MIMRIRFPLLLGLVIATGAVAPAGAQEPREKSDSAFAAKCRRAAEALRSPTTAPPLVRAVIDACTESGPPAIAHVWDVVRADDDTLLGELREWSRGLHDQRIVDAALRAAPDAGREPIVRFVALQVLVNYIDPRWTANLEELQSGVGVPLDMQDARQGTGGPSLGHMIDVAVWFGSIPPGPQTAERIVATLRTLARTEGDSLAWAARGLWQQIVSWKPELGLVDAQALTLTPVCGDRYGIVNPLPISLGVELVGGRGMDRVRVPRSDTLTVSRSGANEGVTLRHAGRDLTSAPPPTNPCP